MATKFELDADVREDMGKGASRRLRHMNQVPAVLYGAGEPAVTLTLNHDKVYVALKQEAFYSSILNLKMGKKHEKVILKNLQRHPSKPRIQHIDFLRIRADQKLKMNIPLHFLGEADAPGLKEGGVFSHHMTDVEVSCLPADLPEHIDVDVSQLALNQSVHLSQLNLPKGVELVAFAHGVENHDQPVVSIEIPRVIEEVVEVASAEAPPAEGEAAPETAQPAAEGETKKE